LEVLILCGSSRPDSSTHRALEVAAEGIVEAGGVPVWADPWMANLPVLGTEGGHHSAVAEHLRAARRARGFLWGTPEYHGTCSGMLKNALDYLSRENTEGKWAALVATSGGRQGAVGTLITLRMVARSLHIWTLPGDVSLAASAETWDQDGNLSDQEMARRLRRLGSDLVDALRLFDHPRV
jgi:FMN reductase